MFCLPGVVGVHVDVLGPEVPRRAHIALTITITITIIITITITLNNKTDTIDINNSNSNDDNTTGSRGLHWKP